MATQEKIRVGSIVQCSCGTGIVLAYPSPRARQLIAAGAPSADVYWFKGKYTDWEYISYLEVLVR